MKQVKTIFIGTSHEGLPSLMRLIQSEQFNVIAVITQPDRPAGRSQKMRETPVKKLAQKHQITVYTPNNNRENYKKIMEEENPELIITISFGEILPKFIINYPKYKCLNVHYSLLPKYRGAVPVQAAILAGDQKTGVTIQVMAAKLDEGPVIAQKEVKIEDDETTPTLKFKLIPAGTNLLMKTLPQWIAGEIEARPQGKCEGPYCCTGDISKKSAHIKWSEMEPQYIERVVRAMLPWPVAWTSLPDGKRLKIFEASIEDINHSKNAGELFKKDKFIYFATKYPHKAIKLETVQKEGKQKLSGKQFACGYKINK